MATINGTTANDVMTGTTENDVINGGAGNDRINGGAGDDTVYGGDGTDTLTGDAGNDTLFGGNGNDGFFGGGGNDTFSGDAGDDTMYGDGGNDILIGGEGADKMFGGTGDDVFYANAGDTIVGGGGNDTVVVEISAATYSSAQREDLAALKSWLASQAASAGSSTALAAQATGAVLALNALGISISVVENIKIMVDGVETPIDSLLNKAPVAEASVSVTNDENTDIVGRVVATDADGDVLTFTLASAPAHGTLTLDAATGAYTYTPAANFNGLDSFQVTVTDPSGATVLQTVSVGVTSVNDAPVANGLVTITTKEDTKVVGQVIATDADGDVLTFTVSSAPAHGTLTLDAATGVYTYTPAANFNGSDSFQVTVTDPSGATVLQTISVGVTPVNDAPVADELAAIATQEDTAFVGQVIATDSDGDALTFTLASAPANGTLTLDAATGVYTYTPAANFNGSDSFQVTVTDPSGAAAVQTISVSVTPGNDAPAVAGPGSIATTEDTEVSGHVIATDSDGDVLVFTLASAPAHGTLTLDAATGAYIYTPAANYAGNDAFDVAVTDPSGAVAIQRVQLTVKAVADAPVLSAADVAVEKPVLDINAGGGNDTINATGAVTITAKLDIAAALSDLDGSETLSIRISDLPAGATLSAGIHNADGSWTLTQAQLQGLTLTAQVTTGFSVHVAAIATEGNGSVASASTTFDITLTGRNTLNGGSGSDKIYGSAGDDLISGGDGNDTIYSNGGDDTIYGGSGHDTVYGGAGHNVIRGFGGNDKLYGGTGYNDLSGGDGNDTITGGAGTNLIYGDDGDDRLTGGSGDNFIFGDLGADTITGGTGRNELYGGSGNDKITGGAGNDLISGDLGSDVLTGGAGADTFKWGAGEAGKSAGTDTIKDFGIGDVLDFREIVTVGNAPLNDFVRVTDGANGSTVTAKIGGAFVTVAVLDNVHSVTATDLFLHGQLLVA